MVFCGGVVLGKATEDKGPIQIYLAFEIKNSFLHLNSYLQETDALTYSKPNSVVSNKW